MFEMIMILRIKYDESRNRNNFWWGKFTTLKQSQLDRYFCATLLTAVYLCYNQIKLTNNVITTLIYWGKAPIRSHDGPIQPLEVR